MALFRFRLATGGSLFICSQDPSAITVGPIVIPSFYRALDGDLRVPSEQWPAFQREQAQFRGPFNTVTDYLLCAVKAELNFLKLHRPFAMPSQTGDPAGGEGVVARGEATLLKALELYPLFPGDMPVYSSISSLEKPFSIHLDDFRLSNIMACSFRLANSVVLTYKFRSTRLRVT